MERGLGVLRCTADQVIELLWRDGLVPEWINLSVYSSTTEATVIEVLCCGRYTANSELLYHEHEGYPPFHVLGPTLPVGYDWQRDAGTKFSVFDRAECCTLAELEALEAHAHKLWSLTLYGSAFTDDALVSIPRAAKLELLETVGSPLRGPGLMHLAAHPKLRLLRLRLHAIDRFSLPNLAKLSSLRTLELYNLPESAWAGPDFARHARRLEELCLESEHMLTLPSKWPRALTELRIVADRVCGGSIPARLDSLTLRLAGQDPDELERLLASLRAVDCLDLSSTAITDAILDRTLERVTPGTVRVVDTSVSEAYLRELAVRRPGLRITPRLQ
jgi:hypothetical protein